MCAHLTSVISFLSFSRHEDNPSKGVRNWAENLEDAGSMPPDDVIDASDEDETVEEWTIWSVVFILILLLAFAAADDDNYDVVDEDIYSVVILFKRIVVVVVVVDYDNDDDDDDNDDDDDHDDDEIDENDKDSILTYYLVKWLYL